jgi:hypothetical protein
MDALLRRNFKPDTGMGVLDVDIGFLPVRWARGEAHPYSKKDAALHRTRWIIAEEAA